MAAIFLRDEKVDELRLHEGSVFGVTADALGTLKRLHMDAAQYRFTVSGSQKPFLSGRLSSDRRLLSGYRPLITTLLVESAVVVPLILRDHSLGELMLGSRKAEFFNDYDLQLISTAAGQLASAIDAASRANLTDEALRWRVEQLTSIARVSRELNSMTDLRSLLEVVHNESLRTARADCGTILLFDTDASSDPLPVSLAIGCPFPENLSPIEQQVIPHRRTATGLGHDKDEIRPVPRGGTLCYGRTDHQSGTNRWSDPPAFQSDRLLRRVIPRSHADPCLPGCGRDRQCPALSGTVPAFRTPAQADRHSFPFVRER
ncbi:MAG: GAF domain-containing protein [Ignavibacteriales bacterium]|nr:GAF domain-containing protein [Ignavibacteriales bacterium]